MATTRQILTREEFDRQYAGVKPYAEYWHGEVAQKAMPTLLHSLLQRIILEMLLRVGYKAFPELEIRVDPDWSPVPDVVATTGKFESPYPTKNVEVVIEILSPEDRMNRVIEKCQRYAENDVQAVLVLDPEHRGAWRWNDETVRLESVLSIHLPNGREIPTAEIWAELNRALDLAD